MADKPVEYWMVRLINRQIERLTKEVEALKLGLAGLRRANKKDGQKGEKADGTEE